MNLGVKDATALVVGGSHGIGGAVVRMLAEEGANVTAVARNESRLEALASAVRDQARHPVRTLVCDVFTPGDIERAVKAAAHGSRLDIAVLAAGGSHRGHLGELSDADWLESFELNLLSAVRLARASAPLLRASHGTLTFLGAASGKQPTPGQIASNVSKGALINLTRSLAEELAPEVRVNSVCPARVRTSLWERKALAEGKDHGLTAEEYFAKIGEATLLKRMAAPEEIAAVVVFLSSPRASYITGQSLSADGGLVKAII